MLKLNLQRIFVMRGIHNPYSFLIQHGFSETTAARLIHKKSNSFNLRFIEKLCIILKCTPNDLFAWTPGKKDTLPDELPLSKLRYKDHYNVLSELRTNLPIDELEEMMKSLSERGVKKDNSASKSSE